MAGASKDKGYSSKDKEYSSKDKGYDSKDKEAPVMGLSANTRFSQKAYTLKKYPSGERTALHVACEADYNSSKMVELLLTRGADVDALLEVFTVNKLYLIPIQSG